MTDELERLQGLVAGETLPRISIVIPVYNGEQWITDALYSCARQRYDALQIVVIDDGSTDNTYDAVCSFADTHQFVSTKIIQTTNRGASAARNTGLENANGDYVLFLDADDKLADGSVSHLCSLATRTGADSVFGSHCNFDDVAGLETPCPRSLVYADAYANIVRALWFQGAALLRRTNLRWNEGRVIWEGMEYILDFVAEDRSVAFTDATIVKVRQHRSKSRISERFNHFEPAMTGEFFAEQKRKLTKCNKLTFERESALDLRIMGNAYELLKQRRANEAERLFRQVNWENVANNDWCHVGSLGWVARFAGYKLGTRGFFIVNKLLRNI